MRKASPHHSVSGFERRIDAPSSDKSADKVQTLRPVEGWLGGRSGEIDGQRRRLDMREGHICKAALPVPIAPQRMYLVVN